MLLSSSALLSSVPNFRDLGGYRSECGRTVRHGLIYRSADFSQLSPDDLKKLRNLNIRLRCDVRSESERLQTPGNWPTEHRTEELHLNISADLRASHEAITQLLSGTPTEEHASQAMRVTYRLFPAAFAPRLAQLFERILSNERLPLVFHCAAGKDRTGFIAAILLSALGVPRELIYSDYMLTAERWTGPYAEAAIRHYLAPLCNQEPSIEVIRILGGVNQAYLDAAFIRIDEDFGGIEAYLNLIGLDPITQDRLRGQLLI